MRRAVGLVLLLLATALAGCIGTGDDPLDPASGPGASGVFSDTAVFEGIYDTTGPYSRPLTQGVFDILEPEVVELESDVDGATIQMGIVRPDVPAGTRVPVIVDASMYYDPMTPEGIQNNPHRDDISWWSFDHYEYLVPSFVPHGYAVAFLAVRGTGDSGGCFTVFEGPNIQADIDQATTWLGTQAWSTGRVGMFGISGEATTQLAAAALGNPHLATIVPVAGPPEFRPVLFRNGTLQDGGEPLRGPGFLAFSLAFSGYGLGLETISALGAADDPVGYATTLKPSTRAPAHRVQGVTCPDHADAASAIAYSAATLRADDPAGFWAPRDYGPGVARQYEGSVFIVGGFGDELVMRTLYPFTTDLAERGMTVKQLLGQWGHAYPDYRIFGDQDANKRWDFQEILLHWFDRWLKEDASVDIGPAVQVQDTSGAWRRDAVWPPADAAPTAWYLALDGTIANAPDTPAGSSVLCPEPGADVRTGTASCMASLRFESAPATDEVRFAGRPTLHIALTPHGTGGQLHATISFIDPNGETRLGDAVIDLRVADGTDEPEPVTMGEAIVARMQSTPMDVVVPAGARLVVTIEPLNATVSPSPGAHGPVEIHLGGDASVLTLHTFERAPDDPRFFEPPGVTPGP